ncbi:MAG: hypothetical protein E7527_05320 [Ruminococcaceae bacterium]|nr:hypothetical protein [Oscillospiraceae bacterium]
MKKMLALVLGFVLCFGLTACGDSQVPLAPVNAPDTGEVILTAENAFDYLAFDIKLDKVQRWHAETATRPGQTAPTIPEEERDGFGQCTVLLDVFAKKAVTFDSVTITYDLVATRDVYTPIEGKTLQLKYDGTAADSFFYSCKVPGDNPEFQVVIKSITGKVITK